VNILIINSVPQNGGDEALLKATIKGLSEQFTPTPKFTILCNNPEKAKQLLPQYNFDLDWSHALFLHKKPFSLLLKKAPFLFPLLKPFKFLFFPANKAEKRVLEHFHQADMVVTSAGGYINQFYPINMRLACYQFVQKLGKPLIHMNQSFGPFKTSQENAVRNVLGKSNLLIARENYSFQRLKQIGLKESTLIHSTDAAFIFDHQNKTTPQTPQKIALAFRTWGSGTNTENLLENARKLCTYLVEQKGCSITFLSTCQGVVDYKDDSKVAREIGQKLSSETQQHIQINNHRFTAEELVQEYAKHDAYIGMRLHGAILSMLGGTPALNLGYEEKTKGIFQALDNDHFFDFNTPWEEWQFGVDHFFTNYQTCAVELSKKLAKQKEIVIESFAKIAELMNNQ